MAGLVKAKDYDWKDSNLALFGSDTEKQIKKESALTEKAWERVGKAKEPFLFVWRVKKFTLEEVKPEDVGTFYNGDSYVVCKGTKLPDKEKLLYDVHFWIGKHSTQDEYGTAAYKTVELDTYLDDAAIQHREVEGYESERFKGYFNKLVILKGGYASGFRHVEPEKYRPRLLRFCKEGKITYMRQVEYTKSAVDSGDVFILDLGATAYQFNGSKCSAFEKSSAAAFLQDLESSRNGRCVTHVLEEKSIDKDVSPLIAVQSSVYFTKQPHEFWKALPDKPLKPEAEKVDVVKSLYKVSDASGKIQISMVCEGSAPKNSIKPDDVYMIQDKSGLFVYIGKDCSHAEKRNAFSIAHKFLQTSKNPFLPITVVTEEQAASFLAGIWD
ncbi:unnamed protein product [Dibothriocephalus latus]|uniref:Gelsolin-like domain-containing protein n=1 Tax=Dibothriocephalus latus TaxID=60516 RepID=A0A3P7NQG3_DIBLA|nr:unnamed protein product [Dibothriocephalus latus]